MINDNIWLSIKYEVDSPYIKKNEYLTKYKRGNKNEKRR